ncbi:MAG TPA: helical backbone metal receptor [Polyangiaceae bacterium]
MKREARFRDALGREVILARTPRTIVSLVPSDTYSLVTLGVADRLIGRTHYCVEPADVVRSIPEMGGTKNADVDAIIAAFPDLVVANQEENSKRDLEKIAQAGIAVYVSFPKRVAGGLAHLARLARMLDVAADNGPRDLLRRHYEVLRAAERARAKLVPVRTFVPIWMDPLMTIHGDTFISDALDLAGAANVFADRPRRYPLAADLGKKPPLSQAEVQGRDTRYPRVTWEEVVARAPELVLLPDEPHAFTEADAERFRALDIPAARVLLVNGKDFSWYGARSLEAIPRVREIIDSSRPNASGSC